MSTDVWLQRGGRIRSMGRGSARRVHTVALIGDSTMAQDGNGATNVPAALATDDWVADHIWFYAVGSKNMVGSDANSLTTMQNITQARSDLGREPDVWVIQLGTNDATQSASTIRSRMTTVLNSVKASNTAKVLWIGLAGPTGHPGPPATEAQLLNFNAVAAPWLASEYPDSRYADFNSFIKALPNEASLWNGVHMTVPGYAAKNQFLADELKAVL